ncbi:MAG: hypothetical protein NXI24_23955 [bacterium]|nr:hypothetical protein [bacterium]
MNCTFCGKALSVHLLDPGEGGWQDRLYCSACRSFQHLPGDTTCLYCSSTYRHFLASGRLGCAHCYDAFAADLEPLVEQYHGAAAEEKNSAPGKPAEAINSADAYRPGRLARARSQEIVRMLTQSDAADLDPGERQSPGGAQAFREAARASGQSDGRFSSDAAEDPADLEQDAERPHSVTWRIRVARNIAGLPYRLDAGERDLLDAILLGPGSSLATHLPGGLEPIFSGPELAGLQMAGILPAGARAAARGGSTSAGRQADAGDFWAYTGDEDHLRMQWRGRIDLAELEGMASRFDRILHEIDRIDELFAFQYHARHGFLTACPGIGGAGIRLSCLISVENLVAAGIWSEYRRRLLESGLEVRGGRGEEGGQDRVEIDGLAQISNRFWPVGADYPAAMARMLMIVRRIGAADFQEKRG